MPLVVVANSPNRDAALRGLEKWKSKHAEAAAFLAVHDVLVDSMRGRSSSWTRVRVNLRHVPEACGPRKKLTTLTMIRVVNGFRSAAQRKSVSRPRATQGPRAKIANSSCGGTASSCA
jgi:hypothetical protein